MENRNNGERDGVRVQIPFCEKSVTNEVNAELSLPDYQPEIKRLLRVRANVSPAEKYIGAGSAELSGTVDYSILYSGNDGALYSAAQSGEYRFSVPVEAGADLELGDGVLCDAEVVPESVSGRVAGPRKLGLRCRLRSRVRLFGTRVLAVETVGAPGAEPERLSGSAECARVFLGAGDPLTLGDEIVTEGESGDLRVVFAEGAVFVTEAAAGSGCVNCRGEVALRLLVCRDNSGEVPAVLSRRIPFAQEIPADGAEVNCTACAKGVCTDLNVTVEEGRILCETVIRLDAFAARTETVLYPKDLFSPAVGSENRYELCVLPGKGVCGNGNFSLNYTASLEEAGIRQGMTVADVSLLPQAVTAERDGDRLTVTGKCRCHLILCGDGDMSAQEFEIPFRYATGGIAGEGALAFADASAEVISCRARLDGERLGIDAELAVAVRAFEETRFERLAGVTFGDAVRRETGGYSICYPAKGETLWSVAKRYHCPVAELGKRNHLAGASAADQPASLENLHYILV